MIIGCLSQFFGLSGHMARTLRTKGRKTLQARARTQAKPYKAGESAGENEPLTMDFRTGRLRSSRRSLWTFGSAGACLGAFGHRSDAPSGEPRRNPPVRSAAGGRGLAFLAVMVMSLLGSVESVEGQVTLTNVATASNVGSNTSYILNFGWTATAGRLLVLTASWDKVITGLSESSSTWTQVDYRINNNMVTGAMYYKVADGTETSVQLSWTNSEDISIRVGEYSGVVSVDPLDVNSFGVNSGETTSVATGTTAATAQNDELAIVMMGSDSGANTDTGNSWSNGFTEVLYLPGVSGDPGLSVAEKDLTSIGTVQTTFTTTASGDEMVAIVATFKVADTTAPDAVTALATGTVTASSVALSWTAPGDDGATGTATTYDVRYSTATITAGNWASATLASGEPSPQVAGSAESFTVTGLSASTTYYFAIKTSDEVPNESAISNVPSAATSASAGTILLVVPNAASLTAQDSTKKAWMESWDYTVALISANDTQGNFDAAAATSDAAFVSEEITSGDLNTKLVSATIGVVTEEGALVDEFGFSSGKTNYTDSAIDITDNTHYITSPFSVGSLTVTSSGQSLHYISGTIAAGSHVLAEQLATANGTLVVLDVGAALDPAGTAAGRRVKLPWGNNTWDINSLTVDGKTLMQRAIEWATGLGADSTPPDATTDLATGTVTGSSIQLSWTAPGDDGAVGTATTYDVRYSTSTIIEGNWASATLATGEPSPQVAGSAESFTVTGLSASTTYYFAIKTSDEIPNWSAISNVPSAATLEATPPDAVTDLATGTVTGSSIQLSWTAPGDDGATGTATTYDVRYSTATINAGNWASATQATGEPSPQIAGSSESFTVTGLSTATTYYFAIKTLDEVPNESAISNVPSGTTSAVESTPPAAVTNLATGTVTTSSVALSWTAPGDDGATGTATTYDVRYSTSTINEGNWDSAIQASGEPSPLVAGSSESFTVTGLSASTTYPSLPTYVRHGARKELE